MLKSNATICFILQLYRSFRHTENVSITPRILAYHLYLRYQSFQCNVGEDTEIQLALFDNKTNQFYRYIQIKLSLKIDAFGEND